MMRCAKFFVPVFLVSFALAGSLTKLRQVGIVDLPGDPGFDQVAMANGQVVISRPATNTIEVFSPVKRRLIARISQIDDPRGIAADDAGGKVFVALAGSKRIAVINSQNWQVEKLVPVAHRPERLLWAADTKSLYASSSLDRTISIVDPVAGAETAVVELNALPQDMIEDRSRHRLLVSLQDSSEVVALDRSSQIVSRFKLAASEPTGLALDSSHRRLYVAVRFAVLALDADSGAELFRIAAPGGTSALVLDPASNLLYASAGDGSVLTIDLEHRLVDHELPTSVKGYSLAYDPIHKMLFLPGGREGRSKMVILTPMTVTDVPRPESAKNPPSKEQTAKK
jgi:DNA-binding beta-propeller fold protein YncE